MYEDLYSDCPEEAPMCECIGDQLDHMYDMYKDDAILCTDIKEARKLSSIGFLIQPNQFLTVFHIATCNYNNLLPSS